MKRLFKTFAYDASPFLFFIDIFPQDVLPGTSRKGVSQPTPDLNPIRPCPMRIDRVCNGELSMFFRPGTPVGRRVGAEEYMIAPRPFLEQGLQNLVRHAARKCFEMFNCSLDGKTVAFWWDQTANTVPLSPTLGQDFASILAAYLEHVLEPYLLGGDIKLGAANYCKSVVNHCRRRVNENRVQYTKKGQVVSKEICKVKKRKGQRKLAPNYVPLEFHLLGDASELEIKQFLPILIYDDLIECFLYNLELVESAWEAFISPGWLLDRGIIKKVVGVPDVGAGDSGRPLGASRHGWFQDFSDILAF